MNEVGNDPGVVRDAQLTYRTITGAAETDYVGALADRRNQITVGSVNVGLETMFIAFKPVVD